MKPREIAREIERRTDIARDEQEKTVLDRILAALGREDNEEQRWAEAAAHELLGPFLMSNTAVPIAAEIIRRHFVFSPREVPEMAAAREMEERGLIQADNACGVAATLYQVLGPAQEDGMRTRRLESNRVAEKCMVYVEDHFGKIDDRLAREDMIHNIGYEIERGGVM